MSIENNNKINKKVRKTIEDLYLLRKIEASEKSENEKNSEASPIIESTLSSLLENKDFLLYRPLWEELHDRMVYYYDYHNRESLNKRIPLFQTVIHHYAVVWWLKAEKRKKLRGPLVHFDTHDDMSVPNNVDKIINKYGEFNEDAFNDVCGAIDLPVTCLLLSKSVDNIIWATPEWVYDDDGTWDQYAAFSTKNIKGICNKNEMVFLRDKDSKKDDFPMGGLVDDIKVKDLDKSKFSLLHPFKFSRVHTNNILGWKKLYKALNATTDFILDIDLDYFCCNGDDISKKHYMNTYEDVQSKDRVHGIPGIRTPRSMYENDEGIKCKKDLNKEAILIKKRVDIFLNGLNYLKSLEVIPSVIDISDSTMSLFSGSFDGAIFTNEYCPKYFVPYIHIMLMKGFHNLYGI